jgi:LuxR family transcriptional regulator, quorum-sensing system regulator BjaR1
VDSGALRIVQADMTEKQTARRAPQLTPRERECLHWCAKGKTNWEISRILGLSERTVEHYLARANRKLGTRDRTKAVATARRHGFI